QALSRAARTTQPRRRRRRRRRPGARTIAAPGHGFENGPTLRHKGGRRRRSGRRRKMTPHALARLRPARGRQQDQEPAPPAPAAPTSAAMPPRRRRRATGRALDPLPRRDETEEKRPPARGWQRLREGARGYSFRDAREGGMIRVTADAVGRRPCARTQPEPPSLAQHVACTGTLRAPAQRAGAGPKNWPGKPANGTRK
ncbi:unnamed protein product, partial [Prorocentrum cordatum]